MMDRVQVVIIGAGPAGLAAAMQLTRQGQQVLVLERSRVGGLLWNANLVENYPGFPEGISGPELVDLFQRQAERLGVAVAIENVIEAGYRRGSFSVLTDQRELSAAYLVAASGTAPRELPEPPHGAELERKVFSEVYPLLGCRDRRILILGAGDAAFDYALNLADQNQVTILNRGQSIRALPLLVERAEDHPRIRYIPDMPVSSLQLTDQGELEVRAGTDPDRSPFRADYLIAAFGRLPDFSFAGRSIIKGRRRLQRAGRLFMIGDLVNQSHRQTAIAVGQGIRTAQIISEQIAKDSL